MSPQITYISILILLMLYQHCQSQLLCYELPTSDCHPQEKKQCSIFHNNLHDQCICLMDTYPIDIYFLLDSTNITPNQYQSILTSIPLQFLTECASFTTNSYIVSYTNNDTNLLSNPTISELSNYTPFEYGEYSSFCNTLDFVHGHILSLEHDNPILLILLTANPPHDTGRDNKCFIHPQQSSSDDDDNQRIKFRDYISSSYGIYLNNMTPSPYEPILGYHQAFQINIDSEPALTITKNLIIATICEHACEVQPWDEDAYNGWYKARWTKKDKKKKKKKKSKKQKKRNHPCSSDDGYTSYGFDRYEWNGRYKASSS